MKFRANVIVTNTTGKYIKSVIKRISSMDVKSDLLLLCILPCNALMFSDRYMVIAFKSVYKGSAVIIENNLRGFSWQAKACIIVAADAVL